MSKKNSIIIIFLVVALMIGGLLFFYFRTNTGGTNQTQNTFTPSTSNPFGTNTGNKQGITSTTSENQPQVSIKNTAKLIQLYRNPTSGAIFFTNNSNQNVLRFVDRVNSNVYEYNPESQTGEASRLTNTTIPKIQEAIWSKIGNALMLRYLDGDTDNINTFSAKIKISTTSDGLVGEITGSFLPSNIKQIVTNPKGDKAFGISNKNDGSGTNGTLYYFDSNTKTQIFDSPLSLINISWPKDDTITITTKATYKDTGFMSLFNPNTGATTKVLGNVIGLSTLTNNTASLVAFSGTKNGAFSLDVYNIKNRSNQGIDLPTLADKCVWGIKNPNILYCAVPQNINNDAYPDAWYLGIVSFSDDIWMIDVDKQSTKLLYKVGVDENANIDAINLEISNDDKYLSFSDKNDLSLWLLSIGQ